VKYSKVTLRNFKRNRYKRTSSKNEWEIASKKRKKIDKCCRKCGRTWGLQTHHMIPVSKGGSNSLSNLTTLCRSCHKKEHRHLLKRKATYVKNGRR
jgi:5-methylcytosine-specific restriction endonuclease McrA